MRRNWLRPLFRSWGLRSRTITKPQKLGFVQLESRVVPTTTSTFQQGTDGYAGSLQIHVNNQAPFTTTNGNTATSGWYIDGALSGTIDSANEFDLIRFDNLFVSQGGPIPDGAIIRSATLKYVTATTAELGNAPSAGPFAVAQNLIPFDTTTNFSALGLMSATPEDGRSGPSFGIQSTLPYGAMRNSLLSTGSLMAMVANATTGSPNTADVTGIAQNWANDPTKNFGFNVHNYGTADGWGVRWNNNATITDRPQLSITWDDPPVGGSKSISFQQGVDGYLGTDSVWLQANGTSTDGNTVTNVGTNPFLDGAVSATDTSPDDQMLIRYNQIFGDGPGQIPFGSTIHSAAFELYSGGRGENASAQSHGSWAASQVLVDWTTATKYTDATWATNGPNHTTSKTGTLPVIGATTSELKVLSLASGMVADSIARFDVTAAVQDWIANPANNKGLNIQAAATNDGWLVNFPGSVYVNSRPKLTIRYTPPASTEPANNTVDLTSGSLLVRGGAGKNNTLNVSLTADTYIISDVTAIDLTQAAKDAGWLGSGTNTITGPASSITAGIGITTGTGDDVITLQGLSNQLIVDAGGQANDSVVIDGILTTGGKNVTILGTGNISATAGKLIDVGSTGLVMLTASNGVGTSGNPIPTKAFGVQVKAGNGGAFIAEADGAFLTADISGTGTLTVTNAAGSLQIAPNETVRTAGGAITLSSVDDVAVDGNLGVTSKTAAGVITINANTDGAGTNGYSSGVRGVITSAGNVTINVNTAAGGTGNAVMALSVIGGTLAVNGFGGNILWNTTLTPFAETSFASATASSAKSYAFTVTGENSSIGTLAVPFQASPNAGTVTSDGLGKATVSLEAGGGGIFFTAFNPIDVTVTKAVTFNGGNIRITTANYGATNSTGNNLHNLFVNGTVSSDTGTINLRSNDDLTLATGSVIGGPGFSGTVLLQANLDNIGEQRIVFAGTAAISTTNATANAVSLAIAGTDTNVTTATIGGITLGNITVGDGGTISAIVDASGSNAGNITALAGSVLNAGSGKVVLSARSLLQTDNITSAVGAGIGTAAIPVGVNAANVTVTGTNSPVFVTGVGSTNFNANVLGKIVPANTATTVAAASLNLATSSGQLILSSAAQTDGGAITLTSNGTGGGVIIAAPLGDSNTGSVTIDAGTNNITFNSNFTVLAGTTTTFTSGTPVNLGPTTTNNGTIVANNGVEVGSGEVLTGPGPITGNVSVLANGLYTPNGSLTTLVSTQNLSVAKNGALAITANNTTPGTGYDQISVTGTVSIADSALRLIVGGGVSVGDAFTIIQNDDVDPIVGQFVGGTTIRGFNNPLITFTINYAGGDGNDVVATVSDINPAAALLDVQGNQVIYFSNVGVANSVAFAKGATNFTLVESAPGAKISLTQAAKDALWTGDGTNVVTGPHSGIAGVNFGLSDGADTFTALDAGTASISISGAGTLTMSGATTTSGAFTIDEFTAVTLSGTVAAGTGVAFTGLNNLLLSGTGSISTTAGNIVSSRSGDLTISGPTLSAAAGNIQLTALATSTTTLGDFKATSPSLVVAGSSAVVLSGIVAASGTSSVTAVNSISATGGRLDATTLTLAATTIGATGLPIPTKAATITATSVGGVYLSEFDGATVTAKASAAGEVNIANLLGTLVLAGTTTTGTGLITISSVDGVQLDGILGGTGFSGRINIAANTDGLGSQGFTHSVGASITTTNLDNGGSALAIDVNTGAGGTGNAVLGDSTVGAAGGGTIAVNANKGSILWNSGYGTVSAGTLPNPVGGANTNIMQARHFTLTTAPDGGSIGTFETPLQTGSFGSDGIADANKAILTAGLGGIYLNDWVTTDITIASATATKGDIQIYAANVGGSNLFVTGTVFTGQGNIYLSADDDLRIEGAIIGGPTFAGTITLLANRDNGNEQRIVMSGTGSVETTNSGPNAVQMFVTSVDNSAADTTMGGVLLGTVKVGSGGTISIDAAAGPTFQGSIRQIVGTRIDAGDGTIKLAAIAKLNGANPAVNSGIYYDLDGTGANTGPVQVFAKNINITNTNSVVRVSEGDPFFFTDANGFNLTVSQSGPGSVEVNSAGGMITVAGPVNTDGGTLTLTAKGTAGGIAVNAPLGDDNTGDITLDAGSNEINFTAAFVTPPNRTVTFIETDLNADGPTKLGPTTTLSAGSKLVANAVGTIGILNGTGTLNGSLIAGAGSTVSPGLANPGTLSTGDFNAAGQYAIDLSGTAAGSFDQVKVSGAVNLSNVSPVITVIGTFVVGDKFVLIDNDGSDPITGNLNPSSSISAINDPRYVFSASTTGGDGNDLVLTVTQVLGTLVHVTPAGVVQFSSASGINNVLTFDISGANYVVSDNSTTIALTQAAKNAGWTGDGTKTVTGPTAGTTGVNISLSDGNDSISKLVTVASATVSGLGNTTFAGSANVAGSMNISVPSTLTLQDSITAAGAIDISGLTTLTTSASGKLTGTTLTIAASDAIGTSGNAIPTQVSSLVLSAGTGGIFITEADGANLSASASGAADITVRNLFGTLTTTGTVVTGTGKILLDSRDGLTIDSVIGAATFSGTVSLLANSDGSGSESFTQTIVGNIITTNTTANALTVNVNTASGTGNATLGVATIGSTQGGTVTVQANAGSILWNPGFVLPAGPDSGSNSKVIFARDFMFNGTGVGTAANPVQIDAYVFQDGVAGSNSLAVNGGIGGVYVWEWGAGDLTLASAASAGAGGIQVVAANAAGNNLFVTGNVTAVTGNIELWSNDNLVIGPNVTIGGGSGSIYISGNRDRGTDGQPLTMDATASILTTNTSSKAVIIEQFGDAGIPSPVTVSNIKVGSGGSITIDAAPEGEAGVILVQPGTKLDAGTSGRISLRAGLTTGTGDAIGTATDPISTIASTVTFSSLTGNVWITDADAVRFSGDHSGSIGSVNLKAATGNLTVNAPLQTNGGTVTLTAAGVVITDTLGDSNTGAMTINGPLSGSGTIVTGTSDVTLNQSTDSTFAGVLSGAKNVIKTGTGTLTLSGTSDLTGTVATNDGKTSITGTLLAAGASTGVNGTLAGTGQINGPVNTAGRLTPGTTGVGTLNTGALSFTTNGKLEIDLLGVAVGDAVNVTGFVNLTGGVLSVNAPNAIPLGTQFTVISNDGTDAVSGTFAGIPEGGGVTGGGQGFSVSYVGGDGNDVVLTRANVAPVVIGFVVNNGNAQRSRLTTIQVNFASPVDAAQFQTLGAVTLTRTGIPTVGTAVVGTVVNISNGLIVSPASGTVSSITLTFANVQNAGVEFGSLADGRWQLTVAPASYTSPNSPTDTQLRRLFGNQNNDTLVDAGDFGFFPTFGTAVNSPFDFNNDGDINASDLGQFGNRFGITLV